MTWRAFHRDRLRSAKYAPSQSHPIRWMNQEFGYRRIVTTHMHGRRVVILRKTDEGPKAVDSALTVRRAKQIISQLGRIER